MNLVLTNGDSLTIYIKDTTKPWEYEVFSVNAKKEYEGCYKNF